MPNQETALLITTLIGSLIFIVSSRIIADHLFKSESKEIDIYIDQIEQNVSKSSDNGEKSDAETREVTAGERMVLNLKSINYYYKWSQRQAVSAHILAMCLCVAGFVLLAFAVFYCTSEEPNVQAAIVAGVGGAITELLAGTALVVYRSSLNQLNYYHEALHEDERFLASINFLDRFSSDELRDSMLQEILRSEIDLNVRDHQNRVAALNSNEQK